MAYELLGRLVWWGARRYLRKRFGDTPQKVAAGLIAAGVVGALVAAGGRRSPSTG